jgi:hypothetical protein
VERVHINTTNRVSDLPVTHLPKGTPKAGNTVEIYVDPDTRGSLQTLSSGQVVTIIGRTTDSKWLQIDLGPLGKPWIKAEFMSISFDVQTQPITLPVSAKAKTAADICQAPAVSAKGLGSLALNQAVTVVGRNADSSWLQIQLPAGTGLGWVQMAQMTVSGDIDTLPEKTS